MMYSLTIAFGEGQMMCWRLLFTNVENAQAAWDRVTMPPIPALSQQVSSAFDKPASMEQHRLNNQHLANETPIHLTDDYGQTISIRISDIKGAMFEDMANSQLADIAMRLHGARTQAMAVTQANADPKLRAGGSIQPAAFNGGFPRQN